MLLFASGAVAAPGITAVVNAASYETTIAPTADFRPIERVGSDVIVLYATGLGPTDPAPSSSAAGGAAGEPFNRVKDSLQVWMGEAPATVAFAGLAPGLPGVYQVNVIPSVNLESNRLTLLQNGMLSNSVTLPFPASTNVTNVSGSIDGFYPASGMYAESGYFGPPGQAISAPITISEMLAVAGLRLSFDILPGANPFKIVAITPAGKTVLDVDPAGKLLHGSMPVPTAAARAFNFAYVSHNEAGPEGSANGTLVVRYPLPDNGHVSIGSDFPITGVSSAFSFGGFFAIGRSGPTFQTAQFVLIVDGMLVASTNVGYPIRRP